MTFVLQQILGTLQGQGDRLAVFCTHCHHRPSCHTGMGSACQLHALNSPNVSALMHELDHHLKSTLGINLQAPEHPAGFWQLLTSTLLQPSADRYPARYGSTHVVILSPDPQVHAGSLYQLQQWPVHQFRCGLL